MLSTDLTPIQYDKTTGIYFKRDDLFEFGGVRGGKVRTCLSIAQKFPGKGLVTAGSRSSPQVNIVARVAKALGVPCRVHVPKGELLPEVLAAQKAGAEVIQHFPGHNSVIVARAREEADHYIEFINDTLVRREWINIPFGMECKEAVLATAQQVKSIPLQLPTEIKRIIVPVGSGMSLAGILHGLDHYGLRIPVLGIRVGADPIKRLDKYAPRYWRDNCTIINSTYEYSSECRNNTIGGITLDPIYEAKCIEFLRKDDLLWVVGIRQTAVGK